MKTTKCFNGQIKNTKLNMVYCAMIAKMGRGLKTVDIKLKIVLLKCSWICKFYREFYHDRKIILLNYINYITIQPDK